MAEREAGGCLHAYACTRRTWHRLRALLLLTRIALPRPVPQMHDQQLLRQGAQPCGNAPGQRGGDEPAMAQDAVESRYLAALQSCLLGDLRLEPLVVGLSDGYELCR